MRLAFSAAAMAALAGCQWVPGADAHTVAEAERVVAAQLRDPSSAQFRETRVVTQSGGNGVTQTFVCGEVNGKNLAGAYVGFTRFIASPEDDQVLIEPVVETSAEEVRRGAEECARAARGPFYSEAQRSLVRMQCEGAKAAAEDQLAAARFALDWSLICSPSGENDT